MDRVTRANMITSSALDSQGLTAPSEASADEAVSNWSVSQSSPKCWPNAFLLPPLKQTDFRLVFAINAGVTKPLLCVPSSPQPPYALI